MTVRALTPAEASDLQAWRYLALRRMPYLAAVLFRVSPVYNDETPTVAVDDRWRLYVNFDWARSQTPDMVGQALCHEAGHLLANHARFAKLAGVTASEHQMWNIAADAALNDDLRDAGCKELAEFGVLPEKIGAEDYQTPQFYFRHLQQQAQQQAQQQQPGQAGDSCGSGAGAAPAPGEIGDEGTADGDGTGETGGLSEGEAEVARIATAQAIRTHQSSHPGSVPGGFVEIADEIMRPTPIPWQQLLSAAVRRPVAFRRGRTRFSYKRVNRRRHDQKLTRADGESAGKAVFPGTVAPKVQVGLIRDTSGSMSIDQLSQITAEVESLAGKLGIRGKELLVYDADTQIQAKKAYTGRASIAEVTGRGGTSMAHAIEQVWELPHPPAVIIVATDGETGWPANPGPVPVVALVVTDNGKPGQWFEQPPTWITTIHAAVKR